MTGPSFRFRLERVRALRERRERLAQEALAQSLTQLNVSQEGLRSAEAELQQALEEQRRASAGEGSQDGTELRARQAFLERVQAERIRRQAALARSEAEVADRNAKLATAAGEHEMLLRLRDRRRDEHEREQARRESNAIDELAVVRFRGTAA